MPEGLIAAGGQAVRRRAHRQGRAARARRRTCRSSTIRPRRDGDGKALIGGYKIDDEGVAAQKVEVVKDGTLEDAAAPAARRRQKDQVVERPRARAPPTAARSTAARRTCSSPATRRRRRARRSSSGSSPRRAREGLKYGLVIRRFDDAAITGAPEFTRRELVQMIKSTDPAAAAAGGARVPRLSERQGGARARRAARRGPDPRVEGRDRRVARERTVYNFLAVDRDPAPAAPAPAAPTTASCRRAASRAAIVTPDLLLKELDVARHDRGPARRRRSCRSPTQVIARVHAIEPRSRANGPGRAVRRVAAGLHARLPGLLQPGHARRRRRPRGRPSPTLAAQLAATPGIEGSRCRAASRCSSPRRPPRCSTPRARSACRRSRSPATRSTRSARCPAAPAVLARLDVLIDGRYVAGERLATGLRGSANQRIQLLTVALHARRRRGDAGRRDPDRRRPARSC